MLTQVGSVRCSVFRFQLPGWAADGIGEMDNGGKAWSVSGGLTEFCRWLTMQGEGASCVNTLCTKLLCRMLTQVFGCPSATAGSRLRAGRGNGPQWEDREGTWRADRILPAADDAGGRSVMC